MKAIQVNQGASGRFGWNIVDKVACDPNVTPRNIAIGCGRFKEEHQAVASAQRAELGLPIYSTTGVRVA